MIFSDKSHTDGGVGMERKCWKGIVLGGRPGTNQEKSQGNGPVGGITAMNKEPAAPQHWID